MKDYNSQKKFLKTFNVTQIIIPYLRLLDISYFRYKKSKCILTAYMWPAAPEVYLIKNEIKFVIQDQRTGKKLLEIDKKNDRTYTW